MRNFGVFFQKTLQNLLFFAQKRAKLWLQVAHPKKAACTHNSNFELQMQKFHGNGNAAGFAAFLQILFLQWMGTSKHKILSHEILSHEILSSKILSHDVPECGRVCGFVADFIVAMNGHIKTPLGVKVTPIKCLRKSDSQDVIKKGNSRLWRRATKWY